MPLAKKCKMGHPLVPAFGEIELAKKVKQRFPHMGKVRFVSSGTEAVMSAVRLARDSPVEICL